METKRIPAEEVCTSTKQSAEAHRPEKWRWTEPSVWTERMLETLERGVRGGKWFTLIDKVFGEKNLRAAFGKVKANKGAAGVDHETVAYFEGRIDERIGMISERLKNNRYEPSPVKRVYIPKPGKREKRPLGIPTVRDRVVQAAVRNVIEPIFEQEFKDCSYGFRPKRSCKDALRTVTQGIEEGYRYVVDADIEAFFDTIDHKILMTLVEKRIADGRVLALIQQFLKQGVMENGNLMLPSDGTPQGGVISPLLANIYLHELDRELSEQGYRLTRYADDLVILCRTMTEAQQALSMLRAQIQHLALRLHPEKTKVVDMTEPGARFTFLGYDFVVAKIDGHVRRYPTVKSRRNLRWKLRTETRRTNGNSLTTIIRRVNVIVRGWFEYFKHSSRGSLSEQDKWLRKRLRSILTKRLRRRGNGLGKAHFCWPNNYFREAGLFFMEDARCALLQSACR